MLAITTCDLNLSHTTSSISRVYSRTGNGYLAKVLLSVPLTKVNPIGVDGGTSIIVVRTGAGASARGTPHVW